MSLQTVVLAVSDVERAKAFYRSAGFSEAIDSAAGAAFRVVRLTPPGSTTSIVVGAGLTSTPPGPAAGLVLVVPDIEAARWELIARGIDVSEVFHDTVFLHEAPMWEVPGRDPAGRDHASFARFADPDGNRWVLEEVRRPSAIGGDGTGA